MQCIACGAPLRGRCWRVTGVPGRFCGWGCAHDVACRLPRERGERRLIYLVPILKWDGSQRKGRRPPPPS